MKYLIKGWQDFQHYKNRNPPWIKLHFELWTSRDWVMYSDHDRLVMIVCMMLGSRNCGIIEDDPDYIKRVAHLDTRPDLKPLIASGFLIPQADASNMLADASTKTETETEKRRGEEIATPPPASSMDWTLEQCKAAAATIRMRSEDVEAFWVHYASVGFVDGVGRQIKNLPAALAKWKKNQPSHGKKYGEQVNSSKDPKRQPSKSEQRNEAIQTTVDRLEQYTGTDEYARQMSACRDKYRDMGKNEAGQTVLDEALEIVRFRRQVAGEWKPIKPRAVDGSAQDAPGRVEAASHTRTRGEGDCVASAGRRMGCGQGKGDVHAV